ncbi:MAG: DUF5979 domain-containing protein [Corynebacterium sp.]|nr:DUF5979 domain-containing protein [Corynebacterium sp.]
MLIQSLRAATVLASQRVLRKVAALFLACALAILGTQVISSTASLAQAQNQAQEPPAGVTPPNQNPNDIQVSNVKIARKGSDAPLQVFDSIAELTLEWSNVVNGQETPPSTSKKFSVELPRELFFYRPGTTPRKGFMIQDIADPKNPKDALSCTYPEPRKLECAFTEYSAELYAKGSKTNFKGTAKVEATIAGFTTQDTPTLKFVVNNIQTDVPLPGSRINPEGDITGREWWAKSNNSPRPGDNTVNWYFLFSGTKLFNTIKNPVIDGSQEATVVIDEAVLGDLSFDPANIGNLKLSRSEHLGPCNVEQTEKGERGKTCGAKVSDVEGARITFEPNPNDDQKGQIHITARFDKPFMYRLTGLLTKVDKPVKEGVEYSNTARLMHKTVEGDLVEIGSKQNSKTSVSRNQSGTVKYEDGAGTFKVRKNVGGEYSRKYNDGDRVTIDYTYRFPQEMTFASRGYLESLRTQSKSLEDPNRAPEPTEQGGVATLEIELGQEVSSLTQLPDGTQVTLKERLNNEQPSFTDADGTTYFWGTPKFLVGDNPAEPTFTIAKGRAFSIVVENQPELKVPVLLETKFENFPADKEKPKTIDFKYTCTGEGVDPAEKTFTYDVAGEAKQVVGLFKAGTKCQFTEDPEQPKVEGHDLTIQWETPAENDPNKGAATADKANEPARVATVVNKYAAATGTFAIQKTAIGAANIPADKKFAFEWECVAKDDQQQNIGGGRIELAADGKAVPVKENYPIGSICKVTEVANTANIDGHAVVIDEPKTITIDRDVAVASFRNSFTPFGTFTVSHKVEGVEDGVVNGTKTNVNFVCRVTEGDNVKEVGKGTIQDVVANGPVVPAGHDFPRGAVCEVTHEAPNFDHYTRNPEKSVNSKTVTITGTPENAELVNMYERNKGSLKVKVNVEGEGNFKNDEFEVAVKCDGSDPQNHKVRGDGNWLTINDVPTGTRCAIERVPDDPERLGFSVVTKASEPTTVSNDQPGELVITHTYTQHRGGFTITKDLQAGDSKAASNKEFIFDYVCKLNNEVVKSGEAKVTGSGVAQVQDVPEFAVCEVKERDASVENADWHHTIGIKPLEKIPNIPAPAEKDAAADVPVVADPAPVAANPVADALDPADNAGNAENGEADAPQGDAAPAVGNDAPAVNDQNTPPAQPEAPEGNQPAEQPEAPKPAKDQAHIVADEVRGDTVVFQVYQGAEYTREVVATNKYDQHMGTFSISNTVIGDVDEKVLREKTFSYMVKCNNGQTKSIELVTGNGAPMGTDLKLPIGTECTVEPNREAAEIAGWMYTGPEKQTVKIDRPDQNAELKFVHEYRVDTGSFTVTKDVQGDLPAEKALSKEFTFNFKCTDNQSGQLKVKGDGKAVEAGVKFRVGTECAITEDVAAAKVNGFRLNPVDSQVVKIEKRDQVIATKFTNTYVKIFHTPDLDPKDPEKDKKLNNNTWLAAIPLLGLLFGSAGSSDNGSPNGGNTNAAPSAAHGQGNGQGQSADKASATNNADPSSQKSVLANTGASVIGIGLLALVVTSIGIFLAARARKNKS